MSDTHTHTASGPAASGKNAPGRTLGPIELEVIHGTIRAAELEIEAAVERTARSPMIRDQHDYRVALFDGRGRKLTGRSYSAIVEPVFEYFGADDIHPGDVFFWNDPYRSCGGIGHVPDLCTTVPIFLGERLIGFSQVFGHHDDVGGSVPGSLPVHATDSWMEGLLVPPIKLYDRGKLNDAAFRIITRNSRLSEHLAGDLDAEIGAARLGARRIIALADRYGIDNLEAAFDQILSNTAEIFRREILPVIADGTYTFEDYIEADGVEEPRLHALRVTMTKTPEKIVLDFTGTDREARGPINWSLDEVEGRYFRKWLAPTLRSLAASPERAAEIDSNEGVLEVVEVVFPEKGTLITPHEGRPTGMRFFLMLRTLGAFAACLSKATAGRMPADHETIRIWGLSGGTMSKDFFLFREVLGGGGPGRPWADGSDVVHIVPNSRNLPAEFSETRYPILIEQLGLMQDSGGAGKRRGGFGYDKRIRPLTDCRLISNADRSLLGCYGVNGGKAGGSYGVSVLDADGGETVHPGMTDTVIVPAGGVVRLVTTGGGGWGDPLAREVEMVVADVRGARVRGERAGRLRCRHCPRGQGGCGRSRGNRGAAGGDCSDARQAGDVRPRRSFRGAEGRRQGHPPGRLGRSGRGLVRGGDVRAGCRSGLRGDAGVPGLVLRDGPSGLLRMRPARVLFFCSRRCSFPSS
ncbi:hydantoinase B/oxoprolinase family protein [Methylobrevis pamukkalensis]|uniref:Acetophenone carboxylase delta subunit n=1 Tax=Methylobrevis pamukkalensis TaxID=1439726 RepID=A0A1E3H6H6_9HYPH|nr:hydantoinase B/oxoprolinase family protein [Methylobrevis pamukkalensis]ODN71111.1 Acetophenone carboxylase delta subunit [Methylobrevis pamukkalensis]